MPITLQVPQEVEEQLRVEWPDLERQVLETFVVEAYRQKKISDHTAGVLLGFESRWEAIEFLSARGVYPNYDLEEYHRDLETLERLKARERR